MKLLDEATWKTVLASISIPCVDVLCHDGENNILYMRRVIPPYKDVWAFPGGRILYGENPLTAVRRQLRKYKIEPAPGARPHFIGVFCNNFSWRKDIALGYSVQVGSGPRSLGKEFDKVKWSPMSSIPHPIGGGYRNMVATWRTERLQEALTK